MQITGVKYGRTIEVGKFGRGPSGRVWFGWEAELSEGEAADEALAALHVLADAQEPKEHDAFHKRIRDRKTLIKNLDLMREALDRETVEPGHLREVFGEIERLTRF